MSKQQVLKKLYILYKTDCIYYSDKNYQMPIIIKPINAVLLQDKDFFSKQDPYAIFTYGQQQKKTAIDKGAGKNPSWIETFVFNNVRDVVMKVQVWDSDTFYDDLIGQGIINLAKILNNPNHIENQYVDLMRKGQCRGRILVSMQYEIPVPNNPTMHNYSVLSQNQRYQQINNPQRSQYNQHLSFPGYFSEYKGSYTPKKSNYPQSQISPNRQNQYSSIRNPVEDQFKLIVSRIEAHLLKDADWFSKMDPFCQLGLGKNIQRTQIQKNAGKNPVFTENFVFMIKSSYIMKIGIFDQDFITNQNCGEADLDLRPYFTCLDTPTKVQLTLKRKGKQTGKILFFIEIQLSHY